MLGTELPCGPPLAGGAPVLCCPPLAGADVAVGAGPLPVCVGPAGGVGEGGKPAVGVGVRGAGVREGVGVGEDCARQLQETATEFAGPVKVIVPLAGQVMVGGTVMLTETRPLA